DGVVAAPGLPSPRFVEANGIRIGVYDTGGDGPPIVLSHGFPELAFSWRHQIRAFSEAGYRVIAPDQRGYGLSEKPEPIDAYTLDHLCADLVGILDDAGIERAVFCGHDWGGGVVWMMPRLHPVRVAGVIGVNTPAGDPRPEHRRPPSEEPLIVRTESFYVNTFQEPGRAEEVLSRDVRATFEAFMRRGGLWNVEAFKVLPEDSPERQMDILRMLEESEPSGELFLTEDELAYFVDTFEKTGFTGGLNWYRAAVQLSPDFGELAWDITAPSLYVGAEHDVILRPSSADGMEGYVADLERHTIADCGHWTQQEKPEELNRVVLDWLARKVG
ncbi:MAG TPA: alpha/beta hydrolase, partial [Thermoanaerobaculia bacterium]|nr:alpha/beta hydrolase [Thermoanaerobaculia bacterium]